MTIPIVTPRPSDTQRQAELVRQAAETEAGLRRTPLTPTPAERIRAAAERDADQRPASQRHRVAPKPSAQAPGY